MQVPRLLLGASLLSATVGPDGRPGVRVGLRRWVVGLLILGVMLDLMISAVLLYNNHQIQRATSEAHILKVAAYESCIAGNKNRAADLDRWDHVLALIDTMPQNPAVVQFVDGVRAINAHTDQPTDCGPLVP